MAANERFLHLKRENPNSPHKDYIKIPSGIRVYAPVGTKKRALLLYLLENLDVEAGLVSWELHGICGLKIRQASAWCSYLVKAGALEKVDTQRMEVQKTNGITQNITLAVYNWKGLSNLG